MTSTRYLVRLVVASLVLALAASTSHAIVYTFGIDLKVTFIQAKKDGKQTVDEKIDKEIKSALLWANKWKYKDYQFIRTERYTIRFGASQDLDIGNNETISLKVESHRQAWINFKMTRGVNIQMFRITHGTHYVLNLGPEPDPLIIVLSPTIIQSQR